MSTIHKIWFSDGRIFLETEKGEILSRPLEAFPLLLEATEEQRENYRIDAFQEAVRWEELDEDIHILSFFEEQEPESNVIGDFFAQNPQINVSAFAKKMGINKSLLAKYIYGIKKPSEKRKKEIQKHIHALGKELLSVQF